MGDGGCERVHTGGDHKDEERLGVEVRSGIQEAVGVVGEEIPLLGHLISPPDEEDRGEEMGPEVKGLISGREEAPDTFPYRRFFLPVSGVDARLSNGFSYLEIA